MNAFNSSAIFLSDMTNELLDNYLSIFFLYYGKKIEPMLEGKVVAFMLLYVLLFLLFCLLLVSQFKSIFLTMKISTKFITTMYF